MKKQLKRFSKSTLSIVLTLCMLISCMTVGLITTDAAQAGGEMVGAPSSIKDRKGQNDSIYLIGNFNQWDRENNNWKLKQENGNEYSGSFLISGSQNYVFKLYSSATKLDYSIGDYEFKSDWDGSSAETMYIATDQNNSKITTPDDDSYVINVHLWLEYGTDSKLTVSQKKAVYYLHYAENDSGMSSATVQQMTKNNDGTYSYTVSGWDKTLMNMIVNTSSTNVKELYDSTSLTVTADTGLSVDKDTPGENSRYFRMQLSLATTPQNITFTFNPSTGVLNAAGSLEKRTITAGGESSSYKLKATDGSTQITNYGATQSAQYIDGKTITVTVTPTDSSDKVSSVSVTGSGNTPSAVTNNGDGTYTATFTVKAAGTITAELTKKAMPTVSFSGTNGTVTATANGAPLTTDQAVMEGTKVTFTATPNDGYEFVSWSGISATTATATVTVGSSNMNVAGTFGTKGYQLFTRSEGSSGTLTNMKELPNGWFISGAIEDGKYFTIKRVANGKFVNAKGNDNTYYKWHSEWMGYEHQDDVSKDWADSAESADTFYYWNSTGKTVYFVYDPATQKVWVTEEPDGLIPVKIYVKDGTIRYNDNTNTFTTTGKFGDSTIVTTGLTIDNSTYKNPDDASDCWVQVITLNPSDYRNGKDIKIKTEVNSNHTDYYVKGFDVTGRLTQAVVNQEFSDEGDKNELDSYADRAKIHGDNSNNPYNEFTLRIEGYPASDIEVTPIYYKRAAKSTDNVRFYATDFTGDVKKNWGGTLAVYPYVEQKKNGDTVTQNGYAPFGDYPGQPMVNEGGRYSVDIPATFYDTVSKKNIPIQGLTMNNYVWDRVHSDIFYGTASLDYSQSTTSTIHTKISQHNYQTYDFNEFEVINRIFQNDANLADEDIIFSFKYKNEVELKDSNLGLSTYYTESANPSETRANDYRNGFKTIEANDSKYQFEDLTDFYNNRVDIFGQLVDTDVNQTKKDYNPILIVSNGYDFNKVGKYATAWALYKPVDANNQVAWEGEVDHYELFEVMGGQGRSQQDYPGESYLIDPDYSSRVKCKYGDTNKLSDYQAAFEEENPGKTVPTHILDCENIPVKITYEYEGYSAKSNLNLENEQGDGNPGHRSDGRWYYSKNDQLLTAHTKIAIYDAASDTYTLDNYQDGIDFDFENQDYDMTKHTGKSTGIQAYFTNTNPVTYAQGQKQNVSGNTEAYAVSDGAHDFEMTTIGDPEGNYTFMGWYLYNGKDYILAGETEEYAQEAKANDIFVAVYKKVPSGSLNVSHMLLDTSTGNAECYAKVEVMSGGNPIYTYAETKGTINVTSTYIKDNSDNTLRITLRTAPDSTSSFTQYLDKISGELKTLAASNHNFIDAVSIDTSNPSVITATITTKAIKTLFTEGKQTLKSLPFFSELALVKRSVTITKNIDNDDYLGNLQNRNTAFPVRIQVSTDNGVTFADYTGTISGTDYSGNPLSSITSANYYDVNGNTLKVYNIHQGDVFTIPDQTVGTQFRVTEVKAEDIRTGTGAMERTGFNSTFKSALDNYTFASISAKNQSAADTEATTVTNAQMVDFTVGNDGAAFTITNSAILYTIKVKKYFSDFQYTDNSEFDLEVKYNPTGSLANGNYAPATGGTLSETITSATAKTGADGIYTVKKGVEITFAQIPKGTYFTVNEVKIGNSPVTNSERFILSSMSLQRSSTLQPETLTNAHFFEVKGDDEGRTLYVGVFNQVKKSWTKIQKTFSGTTTTEDFSSKHKIKITVKENGTEADSVLLPNVTYRTSKDTAQTPTTLPANGEIDISANDSIYLYYPIGSIITVEEIQPGTAGYTINTITAEGVANSTYSKTEGSSINNKIEFQTLDNNDATVTITNEKIPAVKYEITYKFPSRANLIGNNPGASKYGELSYTVEGTGLPSEILEDGKIKRTLVESQTPYEKNFMQNMTWNYSNIAYADSTEENGVTVYHCSVSATPEALPQVKVEFYFPYDVETYDVKNDYTDSDGQEHNEIVGQIYGPADRSLVMGDYKTRSFTVPYQGNPIVYATRERTVKDEEGKDKTEQYQAKFGTFAAAAVNGQKFLYWSIRSLDRNNPKTDDDEPNFVEVARCYEAEFNYTIFDNYRVYAIYSSADAQESTESNTNNPNQRTTINFLDYSRNHWNKSGLENTSKYPNLTEGDAVWVDFDVAFANGKELIKDGSATEVGVLIERVAANLDDNYDLNPLANNYSANYKHYVEEYSKDKNVWEANAKKYIKESDKGNTKNSDESYVKNVLNGQLTNKNRMEFGFALFVNPGSTTGNQSEELAAAKKNGLYRAYSYIKTSDGNVILCDTPVYFSVKNEANKKSATN